MSYEPPPFPGAPMPDLPPAPPEPEPLSIGEEAVRSVWLSEWCKAPKDPASAPKGARFTDSGDLVLEPPHRLDMVAYHLGVTEPIAISTDPMQRTWWLYQRGAEIPDDHNKRFAAEPVVTPDGRTMRARLTGRPDGPLPDEVAGASPAYDLTDVTGAVDLIEVG